MPRKKRKASKPATAPRKVPPPPTRKAPVKRPARILPALDPISAAQQDLAVLEKLFAENPIARVTHAAMCAAYRAQLLTITVMRQCMDEVGVQQPAIALRTMINDAHMTHLIGEFTIENLQLAIDNALQPYTEFLAKQGITTEIPQRTEHAEGSEPTDPAAVETAEGLAADQTGGDTAGDASPSGDAGDTTGADSPAGDAGDAAGDVAGDVTGDDSR